MVNQLQNGQSVKASVLSKDQTVKSKYLVYLFVKDGALPPIL
jgi:hypothetical protein